MRNIIATLMIVVMVVVGVSSLAFAGGSDSPTPYTVDATGITLPSGQTFPDNGHVNIRTTDGTTYNVHFESKCITRTDAECAGKRHDDAQYIGKSFIPWSAFGLPSVCVEWVQLSGFNEHYGEGGQPPVGKDCTVPSETPTPTDTPTPSDTPTPPGPTPKLPNTGSPLSPTEIGLLLGLAAALVLGGAGVIRSQTRYRGKHI